MRKIISCVLIMSLFLLTGCFFKAWSPKVEKHYKKEDAATIAISSSTISDNYGKMEISLRWLSQNGGKLSIDTSHGWDKNGFTLNIAKIKPGKYYLRSYRASSDNVYAYNTKNATFAWFEVKPGEVLYLGHLDVNFIKEDMLNLSLKDKFNDVCASIKKLPEISEKIISKPMTLSRTFRKVNLTEKATESFKKFIREIAGGSEDDKKNIN